MRQGRPSRTAEFMALFRASETMRPPHERVLADPLARSLLPRGLRQAAGFFRYDLAARGLRDFLDRRWPGARTSGIARTRLIDDWIERSLPSVRQVVLLGAGFDTRAWRLPSLAGVPVFEVDHPDTAAVKRQRLAEAGADLRRARFVDVNFETDDLAARLNASGFDPAQPAIVVWEGVSQYLDKDAVVAVFDFAGRLAPGSRFIFTYVHRGALDGSVAFAAVDTAIRKVGASGEPWRFGLIPEQLPALLRNSGLTLIEDLGADDYRVRIMGPSARTMRGYSFYHAALAAVADA